MRVVYKDSLHKIRNISLVILPLVFVFAVFMVVGNIGGVMDRYYGWYVQRQLDFFNNPRIDRKIRIEEVNVSRSLIYCQRIRDERLKAGCKRKINIIIHGIAIDKRDPSICEKSPFPIRCLDTYYYFLGVTGLDPSLCEKIEVEWKRDACHQKIREKQKETNKMFKK